jgi:hypothetical protein
MRTFVPPATIAVRDGRPRSRLLRVSIVLASAGELVVDKLPSAPSRTEPAGLGARVASGGWVGWSCAGPIGGVLAGAAALGSAVLMHGVRRDLGKQTGLPDPVLAVAEDSLALLIARFVTRRPLARPSPKPTPPAKQAAPAKQAVAAKPPPPAPPPPAPPPPQAPKRRRLCRRC